MTKTTKTTATPTIVAAVEPNPNDGWPTTLDEAHEFGRKAMAQDKLRRAKKDYDVELIETFTAWVKAGRPVASGKKSKGTGRGRNHASGFVRLTDVEVHDHTVRVLRSVGHQITGHAVRKIMLAEGLEVNGNRIRKIITACYAEVGVKPKVKADVKAAVEKAVAAPKATSRKKATLPVLDKLMTPLVAPKTSSAKAATLKEQAEALANKKAGRPSKPTTPTQAKNAAAAVTKAMGGAAKVTSSSKRKPSIAKAIADSILGARDVTPLPKKKATTPRRANGTIAPKAKAKSKTA